GLWLDDGWGHAEPGGPLGGHQGSGKVGTPPGGVGPGGCYHTCNSGGGKGAGGGSGSNGSLSSGGRNSPATPSGNAPYGSDNHWYTGMDLRQAPAVAEFTTLAMLACAKGYSLTCELWGYYSTLAGGEKRVNVDSLLASDMGFKTGKGVDRKSRGVNQVLTDWAEQARGRCEETSCTYSADSMWMGTQFTSPDGAVAIGHAQMRLQGSVKVSGQGARRKVTVNYTVNLYKDWNFDKEKTARIPIVGKEISLAPFARLHELGLAQEFKMVGVSSVQRFVG
ncbi:hypothetical protein AB0C49_31060, partial [Streptomyces sp. NPDC048577]